MAGSIRNRWTIVYFILSLFICLPTSLTCCLEARAAEPLRVALVVGHTDDSPGARSARGEVEREFNKKMVRCIGDELKKTKQITVRFINDKNEIPLLERAKAAKDQGADILLSIHHDSVQPQYLKTWNHNGAEEKYCDEYAGFSLFISRKNNDFSNSARLARLLGRSLMKTGFSPTLHHAEKIKGENRELFEPKYGIYFFDDLIILKRSSIPAVLFECGVIVNREEEKKLASREYRQSMARQVAKALLEYYVNINLQGETDL